MNKYLLIYLLTSA